MLNARARASGDLAAGASGFCLFESLVDRCKGRSGVGGFGMAAVLFGRWPCFLAGIAASLFKSPREAACLPASCCSSSLWKFGAAFIEFAPRAKNEFRPQQVIGRKLCESASLYPEWDETAAPILHARKPTYAAKPERPHDGPIPPLLGGDCRLHYKVSAAPRVSALRQSDRRSINSRQNDSRYHCSWIHQKT